MPKAKSAPVVDNPKFDFLALECSDEEEDRYVDNFPEGSTVSNTTTHSTSSGAQSTSTNKMRKCVRMNEDTLTRHGNATSGGDSDAHTHVDMVNTDTQTHTETCTQITHTHTNACTVEFDLCPPGEVHPSTAIPVTMRQRDSKTTIRITHHHDSPIWETCAYKQVVQICTI